MHFMHIACSDGPSNCAGYVRFATSEIKEKGSKMLSKVPSE